MVISMYCYLRFHVNIFSSKGSIMLWDCISSRLLKTYNPEISKQSRICSVIYEEIHGTKCIFAATANRSVRIFEVCKISLFCIV